MEVESFGSYFWISLSDLKHFGGRGNIEHKRGMERREGPGPLGPTLARPATMLVKESWSQEIEANEQPLMREKSTSTSGLGARVAITIKFWSVFELFRLNNCRFTATNNGDLDELVGTHDDAIRRV